MTQDVGSVVAALEGELKFLAESYQELLQQASENTQDPHIPLKLGKVIEQISRKEEQVYLLRR
jgi:hypothetical protein